MKTQDVVIDHVYAVKVSDKLVPVKLLYEVTRAKIVRSPFHATSGSVVTEVAGGWVAANLITNREVRIRSAAKLRFEMTQCEGCNRWMPATHAPLCWTKCAPCSASVKEELQ